MILNKRMLLALRTPKGAMNSAQGFFASKFTGMNMSHKGWLKALIGVEMSKEEYVFLMSLRIRAASEKNVRLFFNSAAFKNLSTGEIMSNVFSLSNSIRQEYVRLIGLVSESGYVQIDRVKDPSKKHVVKIHSGTIDRPKYNNEIRKDNYALYLKSASWGFFRRHVLNIRGEKCQLCGREDKIEVHHMTYNRIGNEDIRDVLVVCHSCHEYVHSKH